MEQVDTRENVINIYEKILSGEQKTFSPYFFQPQYRNERVVCLIRYVVEEKLNVTPEKALEMFDADLVNKYQLDCILKYVDKPVEYLDENMQHLVYFAYPELPKPTTKDLAIMVYRDVLEGRRKTFPKNYFLGGPVGEERAVYCFRYLCEDILKLDKKQIVETFLPSSGLQVLAKYKLKIIMNILFFSNIDLLKTAYGDELDFFLVKGSGLKKGD